MNNGTLILLAIGAFVLLKMMRPAGAKAVLAGNLQNVDPTLQAFDESVDASILQQSQPTLFETPVPILEGPTTVDGVSPTLLAWFNQIPGEFEGI